MDPSSQFIVPTIIDVPELIVTNEDIDFDDSVAIGDGAWLNGLQFLSSALSYSIGLGGVWRFPYLCHKYAGGAFLVAYTLILITIGLPLILMEFAFGQYANEGQITIWRISPAFEGIGYAMCLISAMVAIYYNIINTWTLHYLYASFTFDSLPWTRCDESWNLPTCFLKPDNLSITLKDCTQISPSSDNIISNFNTTKASHENTSIASTTTLESVASSNRKIMLAQGNCSSFDRVINSTYDVTLPANEYFHYNVLAITGSLTEFGSLNWDMLFELTLVCMCVFFIMFTNFRLTGRLALMGFIMPYLVLLALIARAVSLQGAADGISYYFTVDMAQFKDIDIWSDATTQIFFSLSPCWGGIITLASMNKFHNNFHSDAMLIAAVNYVTSILTGLIAFAILGYMSDYSGIAINEVVEPSIGLIYIVYTEGLAKLPLPNLNSAIFFATLLFLGFSSQLAVIESVVNTIVDTWPHKLRYRKPLVLIIFSALMFVFGSFMCFGNSYYIIQLADIFAGTYSAMVIGLLELIAIAWVYGMENFMQDIDDMISVHRNLFPSRTFWYFLWRYLTPSILFAVIIFSFTEHSTPSYRHIELPDWSLKFGWVLTTVCLSIVPVIALIRFLFSPRGSLLDRINYLFRPSEDWAPSSYVSGPKLLNRHMMDDTDMMESSSSMYSSHRPIHSYVDQDQESNESNEDLKVVDGRANYIIPEEEDDTDTGLITNETNV